MNRTPTTWLLLLTRWRAALCSGVLAGCLLVGQAAIAEVIAQTINNTPSLAAVAAEYQLQSQAHDDHAASVRVWRLWRDDNRVVREYPDNRTAEVWQRDGGTLFHTKYFHDARRGIAFDQTDLSMVNALPQWQQLGLLVSPQLLQELTMTDSGTQDGYAWQRYQGQHRGVTWDITLRTDVMLPLKVERSEGEDQEKLTLLKVWPLAQAPWQPTDTSDYNVLDFADLGDNERDPFVMQVQHQLELAHGYGHEH